MAEPRAFPSTEEQCEGPTSSWAERLGEIDQKRIDLTGDQELIEQVRGACKVRFLPTELPQRR
ncbi:hypothetical protein [Streptomyces sp. NPDC056480]|uniref:hypothetical protein n=1 Tax=Streptomyces sp. NPDC056480 TaxID=3345833 RepID=UPI0036AE5BD4